MKQDTVLLSQHFINFSQVESIFSSFLESAALCNKFEF